MKFTQKFFKKDDLQAVSVVLEKVYNECSHFIDESFIARTIVPATGVNHPITDELQVFFDKLDTCVEFKEYKDTFGIKISDLKTNMFLSFKYNKTNRMYSCTCIKRGETTICISDTVQDAIFQLLSQYTS